MKITLPADSASAITEVGGIAVLLDKNGWKAAAFIAVSVVPGTAGRPSKSARSSRLSFTAFAKALNAKGWSKDVINRHYEGWEAAADTGLVPHAADLTYGEKIDLPTEGWAEFYPPTMLSDHRYQIDDKESILAEAEADGLGGSKAIDIAKNTKSMAAAIKGSPVVAAAAVQALVDKGDIETLSRATSAVAQNRQVERNRKRREEGLPKQHTVQSGPPVSLGDPGLAAFMSCKGLGDALRALVTTFPNEWANLSNAAKTDEDFVGACDETLDKLLVAIDNVRAMVHGTVTDEALEELLNGGAA